jgi:L-gulonate 3-dehydrogenase
MGFVGRAGAISFARVGCEVALWDEDREAPGRALRYIEQRLPDLAATDLSNEATPGRVRGRTRSFPTLESSLDGAAHVQETTPEDVEVKCQVFARLDKAAAPESVLASSASAILPSAFTEELEIFVVRTNRGGIERSRYHGGAVKGGGRVMA